MGIDRGMLDQLHRMLRPLATRVANTVARAVVQLVDNDARMQIVQLGVLAGEELDGVEHFQPYGFTSVPLPGAEAAVIFPNGDRSHPLAVVVADRRYRPTDGEPGDVIVYGKEGAKVIMKASGDVEIQPAPGHEVLIRSEGGTADRLVKKGEFDGHTHAAGTLAVPGPIAVSGVTAGAVAVAGTDTLRVE